MAFNFAGAASGAASSSQAGVQVRDGEELKEIQTGQLGFKTINAETKIRLLPTRWPSDDLPIPSAQLLSVASSLSILAAAGPDSLIIASTNAIRETLSAQEGDDIRDIVPILTIPHNRLTHLAFSSDESVLVVSGPDTGGLIAYRAETLKAGDPAPALRIETTTSLRALVPNPNPQSAQLFAAIDADGNLSIADLSGAQFVQGSEGPVLHKGVACVCWSNRGKQLAAGLASGQGVQLKPDGHIVTHIPKSTSIPDDVHISTVSWLEDDTFFVIYTPNSTNADPIPPSEYYIVERSNKTEFTFHKLPEVLPPFGVERLPTHHFVARLRKFEPNLKDLLLLAATTATDIGIISKSSKPLSASEYPEDLVTDTFTLTSLEDDTRRAALPLSDLLDTTPIGMAIDLSSKDPIINPLPSEPEIQESSGPVPNLLVLNNEGLLCSWWVIYSDSIKEKTIFSGFDALKTTEEFRSAVSPPSEGQSPQPSSAFASMGASFPSASKPPSASPFATSASQSPFSAPKLQSASPSAFGTGSSFGTTSKIGENKSSWASTGFGSQGNASDSKPAFGQTGFGQPAFGTPSTLAAGSTPTFGSMGTFGARPPMSAQTASPAFGKTGFGASTSASPFSQLGATGGGSGFASFAKPTESEKNGNAQSPFASSTAGGGFAKFGQGGGFAASAAIQSEVKENPFAKPANSSFSGFGQASKSESPFAKASGSGIFGSESAEALPKPQGFGAISGTSKEAVINPFGTTSTFKLESTFKGDGSAKDDLPAPVGGSSFGLGSGLGDLLNDSKKEVSPTHDTEADMEDDSDNGSESAEDEKRPFTGFSPVAEKKSEPEVPKSFTTPPSTISQPKTTPMPPLSTLFGAPQQTTTPQQPFTSTGFGFASTTPKETPAASRTLFGTNPVSSTTPAIVQNSEPVKSFGVIGNGQTSKGQPPARSEKQDDAPKITTESPSDNETVNIKTSSAGPVPPETISKPGFSAGDTSSSSDNSRKSKDSNKADDLSKQSNFLPANRSASREPEATEEQEVEDNEQGDEEFSSDFEDSGEDVTQDISVAEEAEDDQDEEGTTEQLHSSPESSFKGGDATSPIGGVFSKVTANNATKAPRPLFREVAQTAPIFPPPKLQQSPRSPSPVRQFSTRDTLRPDTRSVSAPIRPRSAIEQRKTEYSQSAIAAQAAKAREEEVAREKARLHAMKLADEKAKAEQAQLLEDDEEERIQHELAKPLEPSSTLDEFIAHEVGMHLDVNKADIPAQIERLYQDINAMISTLGINARSLSEFMMYQKGQAQDPDWPSVLVSETPLNALNASWPLSDIGRLREGSAMLFADLEQNQVSAVSQKLESCQGLLSKDLFDLRTKITAIRKSIHARAHGSPATAPLSAEQASIQHDLRRASASVQTKLVQVEDTLVVIRAKLAEIAPSTSMNGNFGASGSQAAQKKPTVEAVTNTVAKMTSMAEKKSAEIDVLEAQLRKHDMSFGTSSNGDAKTSGFTTPRRARGSRNNGTPGSGTSSIYHTPESNFGASTRSTRSNGGTSFTTTMVSEEDRVRWQAKAKRRNEVATTLKSILEDKRKKHQASTST